jgi:AcrR family transcriptional regulator
LPAAHGYQGFGVGDVARRAGISLATFYGTFGSKDACIFAGYDRFVEVLLARMAAVDVPNVSRSAPISAAVSSARRRAFHDTRRASTSGSFLGSPRPRLILHERSDLAGGGVLEVGGCPHQPLPGHTNPTPPRQPRAFARSYGLTSGR